MTAIVTGAAGAIGAAIARQLLAEGHDVIAQDLREEGLATAFEEGKVIPVAGDLSQPDVLHRLAHEAQARRVDRIIAAHGVDGSGSLLEVDNYFVDKVMSINATSVVALFAATGDLLRTNRGRFVVIGSQAGLRAERDNVAYCASKFALTGWVQAMNTALQGDVALRLLCPGCTATPLLFSAQRRFAAANGMDPEAFIARRQAGIPVGHFATVEQTAAVACYLAEAGIRPQILAATGGEVLF